MEGGQVEQAVGRQEVDRVLWAPVRVSLGRMECRSSSRHEHMSWRACRTAGSTGTLFLVLLRERCGEGWGILNWC